VVDELGRDASEQEAPQAAGAAGADDDQVGILLARDVEDQVRGGALAGVLLDGEARLREPALAAREHVRRHAAQVGRLLARGQTEPLQRLLGGLKRTATE